MRNGRKVKKGKIHEAKAPKNRGRERKKKEEGGREKSEEDKIML